MSTLVIHYESPVSEPDSVKGWYAQFIGADGVFFGYSIPVREVVTR